MRPEIRFKLFVLEEREMRKATDMENREFRRRWVRMSVTGVCVIAALGFVVTVIGAFPQKMQIWISVPVVWIIIGYWGFVLWRNFRCPVCEKSLRPNLAVRCGWCGTQFER